MQWFRRLGSLFAMLALIGLVFSVASPANANSTVLGDMAMVDGMPCHDVNPDCRDMSGSCKFQIACVGKCPVAALATETIAFPFAVTAALDYTHYPAAHGLSRAPPARPPKS